MENISWGETEWWSEQFNICQAKNKKLVSTYNIMNAQSHKHRTKVALSAMMNSKQILASI